VELLLSDGQPLVAFQHRRLHEVPFTGGASSLRESVALDPILYEHAVRLMARLRWTGLAMVEFKCTADGPRLLEVNGRVWGSLPLAVRAGVDFPARYVDLLLDGPSPADRVDADYRVGVRSRNLGLELVWIASVLRGRRRHPYLPMPPRRAAVAALAGLFMPGQHDVIGADDPLPGLADVARSVRHLASKIRAA
jgi:predicted ATP-grasp superfamily ATP-dependent carboligase